MNAATTPRKPRILVIDDDRQLNVSLQRRFQQLGCETEGAFDGEEGLKLMNEKEFDAVTVDLSMPKVSGPQVLSEMENTPNRSTQAYVFTSRKADFEPDTLGWEARAKQIFMKGIDTNEGVAAMVVRALSQPGPHI